ncbi:ubiquitin hydrolase B-like isoform X1 [Siniperca chuatsi]|nr:ubiquitin hydrolase B-like isoform X1 [Siniperca chuatsi]
MNLSLDLVPGGTVSQCLQEYLKESQLEYRCECDAEESTQQMSFLTLPNVLILQLKRFRFTESFNLEKVDSPILLSRELMVKPASSITKQTMTRYSLVSIVSHLGSTAHSGHYICDGAHREQKPGDMTDRWLMYNDKDVSETTGASVCYLRQQTAYMLFYEKQNS